MVWNKDSLLGKAQSYLHKQNRRVKSVTISCQQADVQLLPWKHNSEYITGDFVVVNVFFLKTNGITASISPPFLFLIPSFFAEHCIWSCFGQCGSVVLAVSFPHFRCSPSPVTARAAWGAWLSVNIALQQLNLRSLSTSIFTSKSKTQDHTRLWRKLDTLQHYPTSDMYHSL